MVQYASGEMQRVRPGGFDQALDREHFINAPYGLDGNRYFVKFRDFEEVSPAVCPARSLGDWGRLAFALVEPVVVGVGVGLINTAVVGEVAFRVFSGAICGVVE